MRIDKTCDKCGKNYQVTPSRAQRSRFCSKKCFLDKIAVDHNETKLCECGCGESIQLRNAQYRKMRFKSGHQQIKPKITIPCSCGCGELVTHINDGKPRFKHGHNWRGKERPTKLNPNRIKCACGCGILIDEFRRKKSGSIYRLRYAKGHGIRVPATHKVQEVILCACGCKTEVLKYDSKWRERKYISGHNDLGRLKELSFKPGSSPWNKGKESPHMKGELNHNWGGGVTPLATSIRELLIYKEWRTAIFKRDSYTCVLCGAKNGDGKTIKLEADHYPKTFNSILVANNINSIEGALACLEFWGTDNGRTPCKPCHRKTPTYGRSARQLEKQSVSSAT